MTIQSLHRIVPVEAAMLFFAFFVDLRNDINAKRKHRGNPGDLRFLLAQKRPSNADFLGGGNQRQEPDLRDALDNLPVYDEAPSSFLITTKASPDIHRRHSIGSKKAFSPAESFSTKYKLTVPASPPKPVVKSRLGNRSKERSRHSDDIFPTISSFANRVSGEQWLQNNRAEKPREREPGEKASATLKRLISKKSTSSVSRISNEREERKRFQGRNNERNYRGNGARTRERRENAQGSGSKRIRRSSSSRSPDWKRGRIDGSSHYHRDRRLSTDREKEEKVYRGSDRLEGSGGRGMERGVRERERRMERKDSPPRHPAAANPSVLSISSDISPEEHITDNDFSPAKNDAETCRAEYEEIMSESERSFQEKSGRQEVYEEVSGNDSYESISETEGEDDVSHERSGAGERREYGGRRMTPDSESDREIDHYEMEEDKRRYRYSSVDSSIGRKVEEMKKTFAHLRPEFMTQNELNVEHNFRDNLVLNSFGSHHVIATCSSASRMPMPAVMVHHPHPPHQPLSFLPPPGNMPGGMMPVPVNVTAVDIHQQRAFLQHQKNLSLVAQHEAAVHAAQTAQDQRGGGPRFSANYSDQAFQLTRPNRGPPQFHVKPKEISRDKMPQIRLKPVQSNLTRISLNPALPAVDRPTDISHEKNKNHGVHFYGPAEKKSAETTRQNKVSAADAPTLRRNESVMEESRSPTKSTDGGGSRLVFKKSDRRVGVNRGKPTDTIIDASFSGNPGRAPEWNLRPISWMASPEGYQHFEPGDLDAIPREVLEDDPRLELYCSRSSAADMFEERLRQPRIKLEEGAGDFRS